MLCFIGIYCNLNDSGTERTLVEELASLKTSKKGHSGASKGPGKYSFDFQVCYELMSNYIVYRLNFSWFYNVLMFTVSGTQDGNSDMHKRRNHETSTSSQGKKCVLSLWNSIKSVLGYAVVSHFPKFWFSELKESKVSLINFNIHLHSILLVLSFLTPLISKFESSW